MDPITLKGNPVAAAFPYPGKFAVDLTVQDEWGRTNTTQKEVLVAGGAGVGSQALFRVTGSMLEGAELTFFETTILSDERMRPGLVCAWDFGDGTVGAGRVVKKTFAAWGDFVVTLTVTDQFGNTTQHVGLVEIMSATLPTVAFTPQQSSASPWVWEMDVTSVTGVGVTLHWSYGNGTEETSTGDASNLYAEPGTYTVTCTPIDQWGRSGTSVSHDVVVEGSLPEISSITYLPNNPTDVDTVTLTVHATGEGNLTYAFDFENDGSWDETGLSGSSTTHLFAAGTPTVKARATDQWGRHAYGEVTIVVAASVEVYGSLTRNAVGEVLWEPFSYADQIGLPAPWTKILGGDFSVISGVARINAPMTAPTYWFRPVSTPENYRFTRNDVRAGPASWPATAYIFNAAPDGSRFHIYYNGTFNNFYIGKVVNGVFTQITGSIFGGGSGFGGVEVRGQNVLPNGGISSNYPSGVNLEWKENGGIGIGIRTAGSNTAGHYATVDNIAVHNAFQLKVKVDHVDRRIGIRNAATGVVSVFDSSGGDSVPNANLEIVLTLSTAYDQLIIYSSRFSNKTVLASVTLPAGVPRIQPGDYWTYTP